MSRYQVVYIYGALILGLLMGFWELLFDNIGLWPFLRDFIRATAFPLFWAAMASVVLHYRSATRVTFYKTIFFFCGFSSVVDLIISLPAKITNFQASFAELVGDYSIDKYMVAVGFFLCIFNPLGRKQPYLSKKVDLVLKIAIITNLSLAFSRTAIFLLVCIIVPFLRKYFKSIAKIGVVVIVVAIVLSFMLPEVTTVFFEKILSSITEISNKHAWTASEISKNWRGYEIYCEQQDFINSSIFQQLFGKGFGSAIDAGGYSMLVTSEGILPYLHNGYYTMLMKAGIIGVFCNLMFYGVLYWNVSMSTANAFDKRFLQGLVLSMVVSTWVVGGVLISYEIPLFATALLWLPKINKMEYGQNTISKT